MIGYTYQNPNLEPYRKLPPGLRPVEVKKQQLREESVKNFEHLQDFCHYISFCSAR